MTIKPKSSRGQRLSLWSLIPNRFSQFLLQLAVSLFADSVKLASYDCPRKLFSAPLQATN